MSSRIVSFGLIALAATACKPPPTLPDSNDSDGKISLTEAIPLFFRDFDADPASLPDYIDALEQGLADAKIDVAAADYHDRSFTLDEPLSADFLGGAVQPPGTDPANQTSVVLFAESPHKFADDVATALEPNQVCIESNSTVFYGRTYTTDESKDAFVAATAGTKTTSTNEIRKELPPIAKGWYDMEKDFRAFDTTDGRHVLLARAWAPKVYLADGGHNSFSQSFTAELYIEDGDKTKRMYAIWPEIDIGLGAGPMRTLITTSLQEGMDNADAFTADPSVPDCKNDRSASKDDFPARTDN